MDQIKITATTLEIITSFLRKLKTNREEIILWKVVLLYGRLIVGCARYE